MSEFSLDRQKQRLIFIDLCAYVLGYVNRSLLMNRFNIKEATASKDFKTYQEKTANLLYETSISAYKPVPWFTPHYEHELKDALLLLSESKQEVVINDNLKKPTYVLDLPVNTADLSKVNPVLRALSLKSIVEIEYASRSSGILSTRYIVPHTLIQMGSFCYVRAFDRQKSEFRTFKLNRIMNASVSMRKVEPMESIESDIEWQKEVEVTIVPNGNEHIDTLALDYHLQDNKMVIRLKKPVLMYFLMGWNIAPLEYRDLPYSLFPLKVSHIREL